MYLYIYIYLLASSTSDFPWKVGCQSGPVSRRNGLISTTGLKADVTGDERPQLCAAIACVPPPPLP